MSASELRVGEGVSDLAQIVGALRGYRFRYSDEDRLQEGIAAVLAERGIPAEREVRLDGGSRIDLLAGRVGIEVKVAGPTAGVVRQLRRYANSDRVDALVLMTSRSRHVRVPAEINGKPVEVVSLSGAGL